LESLIAKPGLNLKGLLCPRDSAGITTVIQSFHGGICSCERRFANVPFCLGNVKEPEVGILVIHIKDQQR